MATDISLLPNLKPSTTDACKILIIAPNRINLSSSTILVAAGGSNDTPSTLAVLLNLSIPTKLKPLLTQVPSVTLFSSVLTASSKFIKFFSSSNSPSKSLTGCVILTNGKSLNMVLNIRNPSGSESLGVSYLKLSDVSFVLFSLSSTFNPSCVFKYKGSSVNPVKFILISQDVPFSEILPPVI